MDGLGLSSALLRLCMKAWSPVVLCCLHAATLSHCVAPLVQFERQRWQEAPVPARSEPSPQPLAAPSLESSSAPVDASSKPAAEVRACDVRQCGSSLAERTECQAEKSLRSKTASS